MKKENVIRSILVAELLLLVPLIAMQFSDEWDWGIFDFIIVGVLLAGLGVGVQMILSGMKQNIRQAVYGLLLAIAMLLIWIEIAVGLFGSPFAGS